jgi:hypothetical protein
MAIAAQPAWAILDYNANLGSDFAASYSGGLPTANPFGANTEWELHGPDGLPSSLTAVPGGIPASGQAGWCVGAAGACEGTPLHSYFQAPWQPGVTVVPGIAGHGPQEVLWTAPASVDEGAIAIVGSVEQMFETARRMRLSVFKNDATSPEFTVDSLPPVVDGVVLQRMNFGPFTVAVNPGDTLRMLMDGSGAGGNGTPTFSAWNVELREIPEPGSIAMLLTGLTAALFCGARRRSEC